MVAERLGKYLDFKQISFYAFENSLGVSRGSISKAVKDNKSIGSSVLENILIKYDDIRPSWLLTGRGEMINSIRLHADIVPARQHREVDRVVDAMVQELLKTKDQLIEEKGELLRAKDRLIDEKDKQVHLLEELLESRKAPTLRRR
jgi:hypothetical protein